MGEPLLEAGVLRELIRTQQLQQPEKPVRVVFERRRAEQQNASSHVGNWGDRAPRLVAGVAGIVRWVVLGATVWVPALLVVQLSHAATFGAAHLGAMHFIARIAPPGLAATAQGLYAAATGGIGMGLALLVAGQLYAIGPASAYWAMAALSAGGAGLALVLHRREGKILGAS